MKMKNPLGTDPYRIQRSDQMHGTVSRTQIMNTEGYRINWIDSDESGTFTCRSQETGKLRSGRQRRHIHRNIEHEQSQTLELKDIMTRNEAYVNKSNNNTRT